MLKPGTILDGKYEILKETGKGGMSVVYLAMDIRLNKQWAVKEILRKENNRKNEAAVNSLIAEANLMKDLDHPSFPRVVDIIDSGPAVYIIMDYIEGESLDTVLKEYGPQPEEAVIGWARQLCSALGYLHSLDPPVIYRDMKPANVIVKPEGNIKIIDFGAAKRCSKEETEDTGVFGTRGYAPPEQYEGHTDARSDIYSLGMTMRCLLAGPEAADCGFPEKPAAKGQEALEAAGVIIKKCTREDPKERYQSCEELLYDLEHPELLTEEYRKKQKRRLGIFIAAAVLFVIFSGSGLGLKTASARMINNDYKSLAEAVNSPESYEEAIALKPYETDAYIKLLDYYLENGIFSIEEAEKIQSLYNKYSSGFDKSSAGYTEINYKIGVLFLCIYSDAGSDSDKIQKAKPYFKANYTNTELKEDFACQALSDCYYHICAFYVEYVYKTNGAEAGEDDYEELLKIIDSMLSGLGEDENATEYDTLLICNSVFYFLKDQCASMADAGVDEESVLCLLDQIYETADGLYVQRENSLKLQDEILSGYESSRKVMAETFETAQRENALKAGGEGG